MIHKEFTSAFKTKVQKLSRDESLGLSISICKQLYDDYTQFVDSEKWGDKDLLMEAIQVCERAQQQEIKKDILKRKLSQVESITPDTEDFGDYSGSYALNAAAAVYETIKFILDGNPEHVYNIATYLTDTIDFKIIESEELDYDQIDKHPAMVEARSFLLNYK